jgi:sulfhydrogenase subunit beta (sulfur reductase)
MNGPDNISPWRSSYLATANLVSFLHVVEETYTVYVLEKRAGRQHLARWSDGAAFEDSAPSPTPVIGGVRPCEPLKAFYFKSRERVARGYGEGLREPEGKPPCIVGAKGCDLAGFEVLDRVFLSESPSDPFYQNKREKGLLITADCTTAIETCFCLALGGKPWSEAAFDINLSEIGGGFLAEPGSEKGAAVLRRSASLLSQAGEEAIRERDVQRKRVSREVERNISERGIPVKERLAGAVARKYDSPLWKDEASRCVECGACNVICPTCHCFLLCDQAAGKEQWRLRLWDSCLLKDFARVAGGANPRERLWMRLRNRFEKKFDYFPKTGNIYACTGCGRCISACPARIDIRAVLKRLVEDD